MIAKDGGVILLPLPKLALVIAGNFSADEESADPGILLGYLPEDLARCCEIKEWSCQPSTHYSMPMTLAMEEMFESLIAEGYTGIITVCGSGVMEEMAYLVNLLWQHSEPVIFANLMVQGLSLIHILRKQSGMRPIPVQWLPGSLYSAGVSFCSFGT